MCHSADGKERRPDEFPALSRVHASSSVERLDHRGDLREEPRLRLFVGYEDELVLLLAGLVRELDPRILDRDALDLGERQLPLEPELVRPERQDLGRREQDDVVTAGQVCRRARSAIVRLHGCAELTQMGYVGLVAVPALIEILHPVLSEGLTFGIWLVQVSASRRIKASSAHTTSTPSAGTSRGCRP